MIQMAVGIAWTVMGFTLILDINILFPQTDWQKNIRSKNPTLFSAVDVFLGILNVAFGLYLVFNAFGLVRFIW